MSGSDNNSITVPNFIPTPRVDYTVAALTATSQAIAKEKQFLQQRDAEQSAVQKAQISKIQMYLPQVPGVTLDMVQMSYRDFTKMSPDEIVGYLRSLQVAAHPTKAQLDEERRKLPNYVAHLSAA